MEKTVIQVMQDILEQQQIYTKQMYDANSSKKFAHENYCRGKVASYKECFIMLQDYCLLNKIHLPNPFPTKQT